MVRSFNVSQREFLHHQLIVLNRSPDEVIEDGACLFLAKRTSLLKLKANLKDPLFALAYLEGPRNRSGRPRMLTAVQQEYIAELITDEKKLIIRTLRERFIETYYENIVDGPSLTTVYATLHRAGLTRSLSFITSHIILN